MFKIFLRLLHRVETGNQTTEYLDWSWAWRASGMDRDEKARSCFWRISLAVVDEEITTVVVVPSFKDMIGPWSLARSARDL